MASAMLMLLRASQSAASNMTVRRFIEMTEWPVRSIEVRMTDGVLHDSRIWPVDCRDLESLTSEMGNYFHSRRDQSAIVVLHD